MKDGEKLRSDLAKEAVTRREFTSASISAFFVGMGVTLGGCGGGSGGDYGTAPSSAPGPASAATAPTSNGERSGQISGNHGHSAVITAAQLQAGGAVTLRIQGIADHSHGLELSADQVRQIAGGTRVSKSTAAAQTTGDYGIYGEHDHTVIFN
jgi:hypothetical protein